MGTERPWKLPLLVTKSPPPILGGGKKKNLVNGELGYVRNPAYVALFVVYGSVFACEEPGGSIKGTKKAPRPIRVDVISVLVFIEDPVICLVCNSCGF